MGNRDVALSSGPQASVLARTGSGRMTIIRTLQALILGGAMLTVLVTYEPGQQMTIHAAQATVGRIMAHDGRWMDVTPQG
jgi:hypothetical protein